MQRRTTTKQLSTAITNNLLQVTKVEIYCKSLGTTETVNTCIFCESLDFLCHSGIFVDAIGWHYEKDYQTGRYIAETGRINPDSEIIIILHLDVCNGACRENVEKELLFEEE